MKETEYVLAEILTASKDKMLYFDTLSTVHMPVETLDGYVCIVCEKGYVTDEMEVPLCLLLQGTAA